jgi:hypothetical protein
MKNYLIKLFNWIVDKRLLDGYLGLFGIVTWYKILADYRGFVYLFDLSMRAWKWSIFAVEATYWRTNRTNSTWSKRAPVSYMLIIGKHRLIDRCA